MKTTIPQALRVVLLLVMAGMPLFCVACAPGDSQATPPQNTGQDDYSFLVAGHAYGVPGVNNEGVHPPFKSWFPEINSQSLDFGVFTGDTVIGATEQNWDEVDADLAELTPPVHLAVGNHDLGRQLFVSRYGPTYYSFEHKGDLFIILDSELVKCNIVDDQMVFLQDALRSSRPRNVFVFIHRLVWVTEGTPYYDLKPELNTSKGYDFQNNFWTEVVPALEELDSQVYVVAGDVGVTWAMPLFYDEFENIHLIASGMGGSEEENFLVFHVGAPGVEIDVQRLDGSPLNLGSLEAYNLDHYAGQ